MGRIIRTVEIDPMTGVAREPRVGANGSVEVFAVQDPLASDLIRFSEHGVIESIDLLGELAEIRRWHELLTIRRHTSEGDYEAGLQELSTDLRRLIAAQFLRVRCEASKLNQIEGHEAIADYELTWQAVR